MLSAKWYPFCIGLCVNSYKASEHPIEYVHVNGCVLYYLGEILHPSVFIHHKSLTYNLQ